ncbi:MAG: hypothetical protein M1837_006513 [Sclerophora amabilis]|nr:MAG: hypothetical protein M1837_006513 [Sclerophora amabilis]
MSSNPQTDPMGPEADHPDNEDGEQAMLDPGEAGEEIPSDPDEPMESDPSDNEASESAQQQISLQNDSVAHFDLHKDSIFCIAQHPLHSEIIATGGGDEVGYIFDSTASEASEQPVLPASYQSSPQVPQERQCLSALFKLSSDHHKESLNAICFTLPKGEYLLSADLNGRLCAWRDTSSSLNGRTWAFVAESTEEGDINWLAPCPHHSYPNTIALGREDGSVWIYSVDVNDASAPLVIQQAYYLHTMSCTAGTWTPNGALLATVSEDGSFHVFDPFGEAAGIQLANHGSSGITSSVGQSLIGLTALDQRFAVDGGLYSVAISPSGTLAVVGGAGGHLRVVGLPRVGADPSPVGSQGAGAASKPSNGGRRSGAPSTAPSNATAGQAGQILASLRAQDDSVETLAFSSPPLTLLAAGSVDGSIVLFDSARRFAVRRHIRDAHEEYAVVQVEFVDNPRTGGWLLTSAGMDGVVRRWDTRGGSGPVTTAVGSEGLGGMIAEWKGHRGEGEKGGVLGFVQGEGGDRIVTAGDE